jgi:hypothetical protein
LPADKGEGGKMINRKSPKLLIRIFLKYLETTGLGFFNKRPSCFPFQSAGNVFCCPSPQDFHCNQG